MFLNQSEEKKSLKKRIKIFCVDPESVPRVIVNSAVSDSVEICVVRKLSYIHLRGTTCVGFFSLTELDTKTKQALQLSMTQSINCNAPIRIVVYGKEVNVQEYFA